MNLIMMPDAPKPELHPCNICGRTFVQAALEKHSKICQKTHTKKRKVFDSSKQRTETLGNIPVQKTKSLAVKPSGKKSNWKEQHEEFLKTIRAAKAVDKAIKNGEEPPPVPRSNIPLDYIQCPSCERHFSEKAADRHIKWCKEKKSRIKNDGKSHEATQRMKARTKYQAPVPGKKLPSPGKPLSAKIERSTEKQLNGIESAKVTGKALGPPGRALKAKSSPPVISRNPPLPKSGISDSNATSNGTRKVITRKELEKKTNGKVNSLNEVRQPKNFPSLSNSSSKLPSPRTGKLLEKSFDDSVLDSYHLSDRRFLHCTKPFGAMAPRTVPGVRTNNMAKRNSVPTNGHSFNLNNSTNSYLGRFSDSLRIDDDDIDEIDISRHHNRYRTEAITIGSLHALAAFLLSLYLTWPFLKCLV